MVTTASQWIQWGSQFRGQLDVLDSSVWTKHEGQATSKDSTGVVECSVTRYKELHCKLGQPLLEGTHFDNGDAIWESLNLYSDILDIF